MILGKAIKSAGENQQELIAHLLNTVKLISATSDQLQEVSHKTHHVSVKVSRASEEIANSAIEQAKHTEEGLFLLVN